MLEASSRDGEVMRRVAAWLQTHSIHCTVTTHRDRKGVTYKVRVRGWENVEKALKHLKPLHPKLLPKLEELKRRRRKEVLVLQLCYGLYRYSLRCSTCLSSFVGVLSA